MNKPSDSVEAMIERGVLQPVIDPKTGEQLIPKEQLAAQCIPRTYKHASELNNLAKAAEEARETLFRSMDALDEGIAKLKVSSKQGLEDIRQTRMAVVTEIAMIVNPLKEVRQFFLGNDYEKEIKRLNEFVEICERLQRLKDSGFLDSVADTMLRLST